MSYFSEERTEAKTPICPKCYQKFPFFQFVKNQGELKLQINCSRCKVLQLEDLKNYMELLSNNKISGSQVQFCQLSENHQGNIPCKATNFCPFCKEDKQWLCDFCVKFHKTFLTEHSCRVLGEEIDFYCKAHYGYQFDYYCEDCKKHLCPSCKISHDDDNNKEHHLIDLKEETKKIQDQIKDIKSLREQYSNILTNIKNSYIQKVNLKIEELEKLLDENQKRNSIVFDFMDNLYLNFQSNEAKVYNVLKNINENKIDINVKLNELHSFKKLKHFCKNNFIVSTIKPLEPSKQSYSKETFIMVKEHHKGEYLYWVRSLEGIKEKLKVTKLAVCSSEGKIVLYNSDNLTHLQSLKEHIKGVNTICQLDDNTIISGSDDKTLITWKKQNDIFEKERVINFEYEVKKIVKINEGFAVSCKANEIKLYDNKYKQIDSLISNSIIITILCLKEEEKIVSINEMRSLVFWNYKEKTQFNIKQEISCNFPNSLYEFKNYIFVSGKPRNNENNSFWMIDYEGHIVFACGEISGYSFLGIRDVLCIGTEEGKITFFYPMKRMIKEDNNEIKKHNQYITGMVLIKDDIIATASSDCMVKLWKVNTENLKE